MFEPGAVSVGRVRQRLAVGFLPGFRGPRGRGGMKGGGDPPPSCLPGGTGCNHHPRGGYKAQRSPRPATLAACLYGIAANLLSCDAAARRDFLPLSARRRGTFFCFAKRKYPKKRRPGAARNPVPNGPPQASPNSPLANGAGLKQIGVLRVRIFDSLSTTLGQTA